jgi:ketosteroid isomerase-like protein
MTIIKGNEIAEKYGPALTKAILDGDLSTFKELFVSELVDVILQNGEGVEAEFTIGDGEEATLTWDVFHELTTKDLKEQSFLKSEAQCLGVLGDRMIMETGRFNKDGEVYAEAYSLLTLNKEGKIVAFEAFSDPDAESLTAAVSSK